MIRAKEGERILKQIREDAYVITLEIGGKQLTSEELAGTIEELAVRGTSHIVFVIGCLIAAGVARTLAGYRKQKKEAAS